MKRPAKTLGFTLMELMLVMFIMALSLGVVLPRVGAGWKRMEDREFLQEFVQTLKRARLQSMNSGLVVVFRISGADRTFDFIYPPQKPIPPNVDILADDLEVDPRTQDHIILFYPDGSISPGSNMQITFDHSRSFRVDIHPILGTMETRRAESS